MINKKRISVIGLCLSMLIGNVFFVVACDKNEDKQESVSSTSTVHIQDEQKSISSISVVYMQGENVVYANTSPDELKDCLVVTLHWGDGTTETITDYVLSGELAAGESVITVSYQGFEQTFTVRVSEKTESTHTHTLVKHEAKSATCTEEGNIEYWSCAVCHKNYTHANATEEVMDVHIPAISHRYAEEWSFDESYHWHSAMCGHDVKSDYERHTFADGKCTVCRMNEVSTAKGLAFKLNSDGTAYTVTGIGTVKDADIVIPSTYNGLPVTRVGNRAFEMCSFLKNVTISESVTSIDDRAFYGCTALTGVTLSQSVTSIGNWAFRNCTALKSVTLPQGVTHIGDYAFEMCTSLTSVTMPRSVTSIGERAFEGCISLSGVTIPPSVTRIGERAFKGCTSLTDVTIENGVTEIGDCMFQGCTSLTSVKIPQSVTGIGYAAFSSCRSLASITLPDSVKSIGDYAFEMCFSLTNVALPNSVKSIGNSAFAYCDLITEIIIPNNVTSIGESAFWNCASLSSVTIGNGVTSIGKGAFSWCDALESVTFGHTGGWRLAENKTETSGTSLSSGELANASTAAAYLRDTYCGYYWKRS